LFPSVTGFSAGEDHQTGCLAVKDGWHGEKSAPDMVAVSAAFASYPVIPANPGQRNDPEFMARFHARMQAVDALPVIQQFTAYEDWKAGAGACVPESRHRLIESGIGLGALIVVCSGVAVVRRRRRRRRRRRHDHEPPSEQTAEPVPSFA
jgi:hypothetical protein